jgi:hypothetical protein
MKGGKVQFERRATRAGEWFPTTEEIVRRELSVMFPDPESALFCMKEGGDIIPTPSAYFRARMIWQKETPPEGATTDGAGVKTINQDNLVYADFCAACQGQLNSKGL